MPAEEIMPGDVWFANFPLDDDPSQTLSRPVVVLDVDSLEVLSVKVTKHVPRNNDKFDTPIIYWEQAQLRLKSTARVSKTINIPKDQFVFRIGTLHDDDFDEIKDAFITYMEQIS